MHCIIFTDLDGTLLNHDNYSYAPAMEALKILKQKKIPLIICTSKTRAEIEELRNEINNTDPFISENGGAIFIPKGTLKCDYDRKDDNYHIIELGSPYQKLIDAIKNMRKSGLDILGFSDMTAEEISKDSGLPLEKAKLAKMREYDEAFISSSKLGLIKSAANSLGFTIIKGGRYYHILGNNNKGMAVKKLLAIYKNNGYETKSIGFGDSMNDFPMLRTVDKGYLVQMKDGSYASDEFKKAQGIGPVGWAKVVNKMIK